MFVALILYRWLKALAYL